MSSIKLRHSNSAGFIPLETFADDSAVLNQFGSELLDMYVRRRIGGHEPLAAFCLSYGSEVEGEYQHICICAWQLEKTDYVRCRINQCN